MCYIPFVSFRCSAKRLKAHSFREGLHSVTISEPIVRPQQINLEPFYNNLDLPNRYQGNEQENTIAGTNLSSVDSLKLTTRIPTSDDDYIDMKSVIAENTSIHEMRICGPK